MAPLATFKRFDNHNEIGPGVCDIHALAVPDIDDIAAVFSRVDPRTYLVLAPCPPNPLRMAETSRFANGASF